MTLWLVLAAMAVLAGAGVLAALLGRANRAALAVGTTGAVVASVVGGVASVAALLGPEPDAALVAAWPAPVGELRVGLDRLSAFFLLCVFAVSCLAAVYGAGYLRALGKEQRLAPAAAFFDLLVASMVLVVVARDAVLFLLAWELMSIASFFLVTFESRREEVRRAGVTYLVASHASVVVLMVFFGSLGARAGGFGFDAFVATGAGSAASGLFVLALVGFGLKAGFWPLHVWLPDAHPAAPSHVSALMSGVMIKMGIYGLLRALTFLGPPPLVWGVVLVAVGAISGVAGVLHALAQHDLKRLLAYHSVENIGIIALGIGVGLIGRSEGEPAVAFLGFAGALLHVLNHGLFKGLLFQGAGAVLHATGSRELDAQGGLGRKMPTTAFGFLVGSAAICGLPPLNGFVSEWLVYVGAFRAGGALSIGPAIAALLVVPTLALIGGLAAACFVKAYGVVFLGEARTAAAAAAHEAGRLERGAMLGGALLCAAIGLGGPLAVRLVAGPALGLAALPAEPEGVVGPLAAVTRVAAVTVGLVLALVLVRAALLRRRSVQASSTWGCGYARPTARMQYTAASFAAPLLAPFVRVFRRRAHVEPARGAFPAAARDDEHLDDRADAAVRPAVGALVRAFARLRALEHGRVALYLAYVLATLLALLAWHAATLAG